jgi:hypothetical protein
MIFLIYDEGRQFQSLSLYNGGIKGASHKSFDYEVNGVGIHINLFKGLELDYDITERLEQIQVSNDQEVIDLPKGDYRVVAPEMLRILPNVTLSKVWQNGSVAVYRYSAPGTLAIVKINQAPNITGRYGDLPERLSLRAALSYFAWYLYRQVGDEAIYYRNNPPKILA